jgi:hypothetical protein
VASRRLFDGAQVEIGSLPVRAITQAWIKISGIWKKATLWIKVSGVWKEAEPKTKVAGEWK